MTARKLRRIKSPRLRAAVVRLWRSTLVRSSTGPSIWIGVWLSHCRTRMATSERSMGQLFLIMYARSWATCQSRWPSCLSSQTIPLTERLSYIRVRTALARRSSQESKAARAKSQLTLVTSAAQSGTTRPRVSKFRPGYKSGFSKEKTLQAHKK